MSKKFSLPEYIEAITANKLAAYVDVEPATVHYWKTFRSAPTPETAAKLIEMSMGTLSWESIYAPYVAHKKIEKLANKS